MGKNDKNKNYYILGNMIIMICFLVLVFILLFSSVFNLIPSIIGAWLAIFSLAVTVSFELYEWIVILASKLKKNEKTLTMLQQLDIVLPTGLGLILFIVLFVLSSCVEAIQNYFIINTNAICAFTLLIFMFFTTLRKNFFKNV